MKFSAIIFRSNEDKTSKVLWNGAISYNFVLSIAGTGILSRLFKVTLSDTSIKYLSKPGIICHLALLSFLKTMGGD